MKMAKAGHARLRAAKRVQRSAINDLVSQLQIIADEQRRQLDDARVVIASLMGIVRDYRRAGADPSVPLDICPACQKRIVAGVQGAWHEKGCWWLKAQQLAVGA